ncbi:MAG: nucleotidyltransferase domain-containing protein [Bacteroidales bacterium]|nr:nucleotidyltransferase domain-containing protein [Bacteroidales bacterium]
MGKKDVVIAKIVKLARKEFPESEIILYGSRARGDNQKDSDWVEKYVHTPLFENVSREGIRIK